MIIELSPLELEEEQVKKDSSLIKDLQYDSLAVMELLAEIEVRFGVDYTELEDFDERFEVCGELLEGINELSEKKEESKDKNYIVTMKGEGSYEKMKDRADKKEFWPEDKKDKDSKLGGKHMMVLNLSEEELSQVEELNGVKEIEEDVTMTANEVVEPDEELVEKVVAGNKSLEFSQWNLDAINLPQNGNTIEEVEIVTGATLKMTWMSSI